MSGATRRSLIAGGGLGLVLATIGGRALWVSPSEATERKATPRTLSASEALTLAAFAEVLLPGAKEAGVVAFVDHHLTVPAADSLLMLRYLDVPPPYADFYRGGLAALNAFARAETGGVFSALSPERGAELVGALAQTSPPGWRGPPSPLFYFAVRADAVDVVYGTEAGFERLGIPYMAHIQPPTRW